MITVAIIAILAAIAYPSYRDQVDKARRSTMQGELVRLAQFMERIYSESGSYTPGNKEPDIPDEFDYYEVEFDSDRTTAQGFRLRAKPKDNGPPGDLTIDERGRRLWYRNGNPEPW